MTKPSRVGARDQHAAVDVMIDCLDALPALAHPLVVGEPSGRLVEALKARGASPVEWQRFASASRSSAPSPWPPEVECDAALIRLPPPKDAFSFALHAAAARVPSGAPMLVFGMNDEGVRSTPQRLEDVADNLETLETKRHARIIRGYRRANIEGHKPTLAAWRQTQRLTLPGFEASPVEWRGYPGVFAKGGLDAGTRFLLEHMPAIPSASANPASQTFAILDYAAGTGIIAGWMSRYAPAASVDMLEPDALAMSAAAENVPTAGAILASSLADAPPKLYDLIISNPPIHDGVIETRRILDKLIEDAPKRLRPGGELRLVVQRRVPVIEAMQKAFGNATTIADDGRYTVASSIAPAREKSIRKSERQR